MRYNKLVTAFAAVCGLTSTLALSSQPPIYEIIRGEYEDKIRRYSPPQKIFSVFAKFDENKQHTMTLSDMLKACLLYNYSETDNQKIATYHPENIIKLMGKEGNIQIYDYSNFVRFVYAQSEPFQEFFKKKNIKNLTKQSFLQLLVQQICTDNDGFIREPLYIESRQFNTSKGDNYNACKRMAQSMFKNKSSYSLQEIIQFKKELIKELFVFEFKSFKTEGDAIDGVDFARSIVKYTENNHKRKFFRKIYWIEQRIKNLKVNQKDYVNFHSHFVFNYKQIEEKLHEKGAINKKQLKQILDLTSDKISSEQSDILFSLLDSDDSNFLQKREVLGVISVLSRSWKTKPGHTTLSGLAKQRFEKFVNKSRQIIDIILQE